MDVRYKYSTVKWPSLIHVFIFHYNDKNGSRSYIDQLN